MIRVETLRVMIFEIEHSVATGDGRSGVTLASAGAPCRGFPTKIDLAAGPLRGIIVDDTAGSYERLQRQLADLYTSFSGPGRLRSDNHSSLELTPIIKSLQRLFSLRRKTAWNAMTLFVSV
jgi:hypothetical protein